MYSTYTLESKMILAKQNRNFVDFPGKMINANDDICQKKIRRLRRRKDDKCERWFCTELLEKLNGLPKEAADATMFRKNIVSKSEILKFDENNNFAFWWQNTQRTRFAGPRRALSVEKQSSDLENADLKKKLKLIFEINFFSTCI